MIIFDRLQISNKGDMLYIDAHVNEASYFDDNYIDEVVIQTADQVSETDPLTVGESYVYRYSTESRVREIHLALTPANFNELFTKGDFSSDLFFVYIICKGTPSECTPCRLDEMTTVGVTFDYGLLYNNVMGNIKNLSDSCEVNTDFIDYILNFNAFKLAVETEHYLDAIDIYNRLMGKDVVRKTTSSSSGKVTTRRCGCHG